MAGVTFTIKGAGTVASSSIWTPHPSLSTDTMPDKELDGLVEGGFLIFCRIHLYVPVESAAFINVTKTV